MNRSDLQQLAEVRIREAQALLALPIPMPDGAYYLAGYAVECALKACIAKTVNQYDWPEKQFVSQCHTHDIPTLVILAGLAVAKTVDIAANQTFKQNWNTVNAWNERSRYERHSQTEAQALIDAITDAANGVLPWIKVRW